jgi:lipid A disaccharide synthetase
VVDLLVEAQAQPTVKVDREQVLLFPIGRQTEITMLLTPTTETMQMEQHIQEQVDHLVLEETIVVVITVERLGDLVLL